MSVVSLGFKPKQLGCSLVEFIIKEAAGKTVLNAGAAGNADIYLPHLASIWQHATLSAVASDIVGVDIDQKNIGLAKEAGFHIENVSCETCDLSRQFDVISFCDVVEHVSSPTAALANLLRHLKPDGKIILSTPNPLFFGNIVKALLGKMDIYFDHVSCFFPEHLMVLGKRLGFRIEDAYYYSDIEQSNNAVAWKSRLAQLIGAIFPRFHSSFVIVIRHNQ